MYKDFENISDPSLYPQFEQWVRLAQLELEFKEGMEDGSISESDLSPIYKSETTTDTTNDLPF